MKNLVVCKTCGAENEYDFSSPIDTLKCFNCENDIPLGKELNPATERTKTDDCMQFIGIVFILLCLLPYLIMLVGALRYGHVTGDQGWAILRYLFWSFGICIFNALAGLLVLLLVKFKTRKHKIAVATIYFLGALLPILILLYMQLHRHLH